MRVESGLDVVVVVVGSGKSGLKEGDVRRVRTSEPSWGLACACACAAWDG